MTLSIGRIVHDTLSDDDANAINRRRDDYDAYQRGRAPILPGQPGATGHQAHVGERVLAGDVYPATVVRVHPAPTVVSLQVHLDGNDIFWARARSEGTTPGTWHWPPRI
ncbi:hypothetical protein ACIBKY_51040 [Nonomuraea sp. NPDC050394]|uniref:hypothetical protein n=1 Tax=Nonomuraea sp. NPDC050394 TaxID=3364363 RepID=UPI00379461E4